MCRTIIIAVVFLYQNIIAFYYVAIDKIIGEVKLIFVSKGDGGCGCSCGCDTDTNPI